MTKFYDFPLGKQMKLRQERKRKKQEKYSLDPQMKEEHEVMMLRHKEELQEFLNKYEATKKTMYMKCMVNLIIKI